MQFLALLDDRLKRCKTCAGFWLLLQKSSDFCKSLNYSTFPRHRQGVDCKDRR